jgi:hypothetical protein
MSKEWSEFIQLVKQRNEKYPKQYAWNASTTIAYLKLTNKYGEKEVLATVHKPLAAEDFWEADIADTDETIREESLIELMSKVETLTIRKRLNNK